jgi:hypothetical protein
LQLQALLTKGKTPTSDVFNRPRVLSDVHMMVQLDAQEREVDHMAALLRKAGFRCVRVVQVSLTFLEYMD